MHAISVRTEGGTGEVDVMGWMARAALELIGQTGIGYSFDPLTEDVADAYADAVKRFACVSPLFSSPTFSTARRVPSLSCSEAPPADALVFPFLPCVLLRAAPTYAYAYAYAPVPAGPSRRARR